MKNIIVIGGGAAGMMAAYSAAESGAKVTLYEKNEKLGKKVFITGKGRCNVTNAGDTNEFFNQVISNPKFLYSAIYSFDAFMVMDLLEQHGCALKTERGNRVFPITDHSSDIIKAMEKALLAKSVVIKKNRFVKDLIIVNDEIRKCSGIVLCDDSGKEENVYADEVILCTGGTSYRTTGSDGYFYDILKKYGHTIVEPKPGLVPLVSPQSVCKDLMGLSLKNVSLDLYVDGKNIYSGFGEMLFTHFGISGPLVLSASSIYNKKYYGKKCKAVIDLKPALDDDKLDKRILRDFEENMNKSFKNALEGLLPSKMTCIIPGLIGVDENKKVNMVTSEERARLVHVLKNFEINILGTRDFNEAIITIGGVSTKEINPSTMESKIISNLYLAGEVIDVDAYTGGYNLQIAWSTGHLAGVSAGEDNC